jgi:hypothetical protein
MPADLGDRWMSIHFAELTARVQADGRIDAEELRDLRRLGWADGIKTREEAEALFAINDALASRDEEWSDYFVEAICEHVLNGSPPRNQCSEDEADWLVGQVERDGATETLAELETLVRVIERAENVPARLKEYVLKQIEREVMTGTGPTRCGGELAATHITAAECRILRRVIFANGGDGPAWVSAGEAEMLFRLKDATGSEDNAPEWDELFVDGVSNFLQGFAMQNAQLEHGRAAELQAFSADDSVHVGRFFGRMAREVPQLRNHFAKVFGKRASEAGYSARAAEGEAVTDREQQWLDTMIDADGEVDDLERRLIARLVEEA